MAKLILLTFLVGCLLPIFHLVVASPLRNCLDSNCAVQLSECEGDGPCKDAMDCELASRPAMFRQSTCNAPEGPPAVKYGALKACASQQCSGNIWNTCPDCAGWNRADCVSTGGPHGNCGACVANHFETRTLPGIQQRCSVNPSCSGSEIQCLGECCGRYRDCGTDTVHDVPSGKRCYHGRLLPSHVCPRTCAASDPISQCAFAPPVSTHLPACLDSTACAAALACATSQQSNAFGRCNASLPPEDRTAFSALALSIAQNCPDVRRGDPYPPCDSCSRQHRAPCGAGGVCGPCEPHYSASQASDPCTFDPAAPPGRDTITLSFSLSFPDPAPVSTPEDRVVAAADTLRDVIAANISSLLSLSPSSSLLPSQVVLASVGTFSLATPPPPPSRRLQQQQQQEQQGQRQGQGEGRRLQASLVAVPVVVEVVAVPSFVTNLSAAVAHDLTHYLRPALAQWLPSPLTLTPAAAGAHYSKAATTAAEAWDLVSFPYCYAPSHPPHPLLHSLAAPTDVAPGAAPYGLCSVQLVNLSSTATDAHGQYSDAAVPASPHPLTDVRVGDRIAVRVTTDAPRQVRVWAEHGTLSLSLPGGGGGGGGGGSGSGGDGGGGGGANRRCLPPHGSGSSSSGSGGSAQVAAVAAAPDVVAEFLWDTTAGASLHADDFMTSLTVTCLDGATAALSEHWLYVTGDGSGNGDGDGGGGGGGIFPSGNHTHGSNATFNGTFNGPYNGTFNGTYNGTFNGPYNGTFNGTLHGPFHSNGTNPLSSVNGSGDSAWRQCPHSTCMDKGREDCPPSPAAGRPLRCGGCKPGHSTLPEWNIPYVPSECHAMPSCYGGDSIRCVHDCCPHFLRCSNGTLDTAPAGRVCRQGTIVPASFCPAKQCAAGGDPVTRCVKDNCASPLSACMASAPCADALLCAYRSWGQSDTEHCSASLSAPDLALLTPYDDCFNSQCLTVALSGGGGGSDECASCAFQNKLDCAADGNGMCGPCAPGYSDNFGNCELLPPPLLSDKHFNATFHIDLRWSDGSSSSLLTRALLNRRRDVRNALLDLVTPLSFTPGTAVAQQKLVLTRVGHMAFSTATAAAAAMGGPTASGDGGDGGGGSSLPLVFSLHDFRPLHDDAAQLQQWDVASVADKLRAKLPQSVLPDSLRSAPGQQPFVTHTPAVAWDLASLPFCTLPPSTPLFNQPSSAVTHVSAADAGEAAGADDCALRLYAPAGSDPSASSWTPTSDGLMATGRLLSSGGLTAYPASPSAVVVRVLSSRPRQIRLHTSRGSLSGPHTHQPCIPPPPPPALTNGGGDAVFHALYAAERETADFWLRLPLYGSLQLSATCASASDTLSTTLSLSSPPCVQQQCTVALSDCQRDGLCDAVLQCVEQQRGSCAAAAAALPPVPYRLWDTLLGCQRRQCSYPCVRRSCADPLRHCTNACLAAFECERGVASSCGHSPLTPAQTSALHALRSCRNASCSIGPSFATAATPPTVPGGSFSGPSGSLSGPGGSFSGPSGSFSGPSGMGGGGSGSGSGSSVRNTYGPGYKTFTDRCGSCQNEADVCNQNSGCAERMHYWSGSGGPPTLPLLTQDTEALNSLQSCFQDRCSSDCTPVRCNAELQACVGDCATVLACERAGWGTNCRVAGRGAITSPALIAAYDAFADCRADRCGAQMLQTDLWASMGLQSLGQCVNASCAAVFDACNASQPCAATLSCRHALLPSGGNGDNGDGGGSDGKGGEGPLILPSSLDSRCPLPTQPNASAAYRALQNCIDGQCAGQLTGCTSVRCAERNRRQCSGGGGGGGGAAGSTYAPAAARRRATAADGGSQGGSGSGSGSEVATYALTPSSAAAAVSARTLATAADATAPAATATATAAAAAAAYALVFTGTPYVKWSDAQSQSQPLHRRALAAATTATTQQQLALPNASSSSGGCSSCLPGFSPDGREQANPFFPLRCRALPACSQSASFRCFPSNCCPYAYDCAKQALLPTPAGTRCFNDVLVPASICTGQCLPHPMDSMSSCIVNTCPSSLAACTASPACAAAFQCLVAAHGMDALAVCHSGLAAADRAAYFAISDCVLDVCANPNSTARAQPPPPPAVCAHCAALNRRPCPSPTGGGSSSNSGGGDGDSMMGCGDCLPGHRSSGNGGGERDSMCLFRPQVSPDQRTLEFAVTLLPPAPSGETQLLTALRSSQPTLRAAVAKQMTAAVGRRVEPFHVRLRGMAIATVTANPVHIRRRRRRRLLNTGPLGGASGGASGGAVNGVRLDFALLNLSSGETYNAVSGVSAMLTPPPPDSTSASASVPRSPLVTQLVTENPVLADHVGSSPPQDSQISETSAAPMDLASYPLCFAPPATVFLDGAATVTAVAAASVGNLTSHCSLRVYALGNGHARDGASGLFPSHGARVFSHFRAGQRYLLRAMSSTPAQHSLFADGQQPSWSAGQLLDCSHPHSFAQGKRLYSSAESGRVMTDYEWTAADTSPAAFNLSLNCLSAQRASLAQLPLTKSTGKPSVAFATPSRAVVVFFPEEVSEAAPGAATTADTSFFVTLTAITAAGEDGDTLFAGTLPVQSDLARPEYSAHLPADVTGGRLVEATGLPAATRLRITAWRTAAAATATPAAPLFRAGVETLAAVAPSAPVGHTSFTNQTASTMVISWLPPEDHGGSPVTGYKVMVAKWSAGGCASADAYLHVVAAAAAATATATAAPPPPPTSLLVTGLADSTQYSFKVAALNRVNQGVAESDLAAWNDGCSADPCFTTGLNPVTRISASRGNDTACVLDATAVTPCATLQAAISAFPNSGQEFRVEPGAYAATAVRGWRTGMKLRSTGGSAVTHLHCGGARCFVADVTSDGALFPASIAGFTLHPTALPTTTTGTSSGSASAAAAGPGANGTLAAHGGALSLTSLTSLALTDMVFTQHRAAAGGALSLRSCVGVTLTRCVFSGNTALYAGGAVELRSSSATFRDCSFNGNAALGSSMPHELHLLREQGAVIDAPARKAAQAAVDASGDGGAMALSLDPLCVAACGSSAVLRGGSLSSNRAVRQGGAVAVFDGDAVLTDVALTGNRATHNGGALFLTAASATLRHCRVTDNSVNGNAAVAGGGVACLASRMVVNGTEFSRNHASPQLSLSSSSSAQHPAVGGAISTVYCSPVITHSTFAHNRARDGGSLHFSALSAPTIAHTTFTADQALARGGSVACDSCQRLQLTSCTFSRSTAADGGGALSLLSSQSVSLTHSTLSHCSAAGVGGGGALVVASALALRGATTFTSCSAPQGGGGALLWLMPGQHVSQAADIPIKSDSGASLWPVDGDGWSSGNAMVPGSGRYGAGNTAMYGRFVASGPHKLHLVNEQLLRNSPQTSGLNFTAPPHVCLHDFYRQTLRSDSGSSVNAAPARANTLLVNPSVQQLSQGCARFHNLGLLAPPRSSQRVLITSSTVALAPSATLNATFRACVPGEFLADMRCAPCAHNSFSDSASLALDRTTCQPCPEGSSSRMGQSSCPACTRGHIFNPDSRNCEYCNNRTFSVRAGEVRSTCHRCPKGAACLGGPRVVALAGHWRSPGKDPATGMNYFLPCLAVEACNGHAQEDTSAEFLQGQTRAENCSTGYTGNLCFACGRGFGRYGRTKCMPCQNSALDIVFLILMLTGLISVVGYMIAKTIRTSGKPKKKGMVAMLKILLSHLQLVSLAAKFPLNWPESVEAMFRAQELVSSVSDGVVSLDCALAGQIPVKQRAIPLVFSKTLMFMVFPLAFVLLSLAFWFLAVLLYPVLPARAKVTPKLAVDRFVVSNVVAMFLFHPTLTKTVMYMFTCRDLKHGSFLVRDLDIECYNAEHVGWLMGLALPCFFLYVIGIPAMAMYLLYTNRAAIHRQDDSHKDAATLHVMNKFGFLFSGFDSKHYYWEVIISMRKVSLIMVSIFFSVIGVQPQALSAILVVIGFLTCHIWADPYKDKTLDRLDRYALFTSFFTLYSGLYFFAPELEDSPVRLVLTIFIIGINVAYTFYFLFHFFRNVRATAKRVFLKRQGTVSVGKISSLGADSLLD